MLLKKKENEQILSEKKRDLEELRNQHTNVSSELTRLIQENNELKEENKDLIDNIKQATVIISSVVNKLRAIANDPDLLEDFNPSEITEYIRLISNALQGTKFTGGKLGGKLGGKYKKGKKATKKHTKKTKKMIKKGGAKCGMMRGGFIYKTHRRKSHRYSSRRRSI